MGRAHDPRLGGARVDDVVCLVGDSGERAGAKAQARERRRARPLPQADAADVADRARRDRSGHRLVGRAALFRKAELAGAARHSSTCACSRRAALPGRGCRRALRDDHRLGDDAHPPRSPAARLAVHQGSRLSRNEHREGVRRAGLFRVRALAGDDQAVDAFRHRVGHGDGAELARTGRAPRALRHGRAEALLPAAPRKRPRDPVLCAHRADRRIRCGVDSRFRDRSLGRARREARAGVGGHVGQALHHARSRRDAIGTRVPRLRSRPSSGRSRGPGNHVRADSDHASRRGHRPPAHAAQCRVPERAQLGQGRLHPDGLGDRRAADAGPRMADADGVPRRRARHLAAVVRHRNGQARGARRRRLCAGAPAIQDADRQVRGHRGGAHAEWAATCT